MNDCDRLDSAPLLQAPAGPQRCALIGADTLLLECAQLLLDRGHELVAVVAGSQRVADWAHGRGVRVLRTTDDWVAALQGESIDILFAITHLHLLPPAALALPQRWAINFHDGPLPTYAGLNTPVWGLLRGEVEWGVSWHLVTDGVDTGDVLVQHRFPLSLDETSLSLNTANVEHALDSFGVLLDQLADGTLARTPQRNDAARTTYRRADRPAAAGVLDWHSPATDLHRAVRALHFGPHPNPVGAALLWHPTAPAIVTAAAVVDGAGAPGQVLVCTDQALDVACGSQVLRITELTTLHGARLTPAAWALTAGVAAGAVLAGLTAHERDALTSLAVAAQPHEAAVVAALRAHEPAEFPWPHGPAAGNTSVSLPLQWPADLALADAAAALGIVLGRLSGNTAPAVALALPRTEPAIGPLLSGIALLELPGGAATVAAARASAAAAVATAQRRGPWLHDLVARTPELAGRAEFADGLRLPIGLRPDAHSSALPGALAVVEHTAAGWQLAVDSDAVDATDARLFADCLAAAAACLANGDTATASVPLLGDALRGQLIDGWNATDLSVDTSGGIHTAFAAQAAATPDHVAVRCGADEVTYAQLHQRAAALAAELQSHGVGRDSVVAVHVDRSSDLLVAVLGVLLAGGAYVPLDPAYPSERLQHMIADSGAAVVVCQRHHAGNLPLPADGAERTIICVDDSRPVQQPAPTTDEGSSLAYCIYTSGSTGVPKGVLVEHRNVLNFFAAMDAVVPRTGNADTWFAVTSLSFDISVLELLYTVTRGYRVVVHVDHDRASVSAPKSTRHIDFSLFYFSGDEADGSGPDKYRLLLDGARFADANGFVAVWTPERHFHAFGGLYPQPAVTAAAVAAVTQHVQVRAGSVVLPLHHPVEIAEAWSVVDNLSNGRVGIAMASGWQPNDFIFRPENYRDAKQVMFDGIEQVRALWRGETLTFPGPEGNPVPVATLPRPVQPEVPIWVTTAGNPETFEQAGAAGAHLLTHLLGQSVEQVAPKIAAYRAARARAGHDPDTGIVTLMLHTFVGEDDATVQATVREPLKNYLATAFNLVREYAWSFPTFKRPDGSQVDRIADLADEDVEALTPDELDAVLEFAFQRYYQTSGLFGTPQSAAQMAERLKAIGVDEIGCLLDFGCPSDTVLAALPHLAEALRLSNEGVAAGATGELPAPLSIGQQIAAAGTTHLQCTPSMAHMLVSDATARAALGNVRRMLVGGEALPAALATELQAAVGGSVTNMYGPTETTIWSSTWSLRPGLDWVPIGNPIANNQLYVLDAALQPQPPGVTGDLWIGGDGVVRGYHQRPELNAERFRTDPFRSASHPDARMYFTGDRARWRVQPDGTPLMEFLGRSDHQVKLRGYRIELGEVEARLGEAPGVGECVAIVRDDADLQQLVAYVVPRHHAAVDPRATRELLRTHLPEVMVPAHVVVLPSLPRTPNGKLDRAALPAPQAAGRATVAAAPGSEIEHTVLQAWRDVLATDAIGIDDNFFDIGGHSLLVVRLHRLLQERIGRPLPLTDLYRHPTVRTFAASLGTSSDDEPAAISTALDRAARRRNTLRTRG